MDKRPVFRDTTTEKAFKNVEFFYSLLSSGSSYNNDFSLLKCSSIDNSFDCSICLDFFEIPQILPCGHCFCLSCISRASEFTRRCPLCSEFFWIYKPVRICLTEKIENTILLKRLELSDVCARREIDFYDFPYSLEYYLNSSDSISIELENISLKNEVGNSSESNRYNAITRSNLNKICSVGTCNSKRQIFYQSHDGQLFFLDPKVVDSLKSKPLFIYSNIKTKRECSIDHREFPSLSHIPSGTRIVIVVI